MTIHEKIEIIDMQEIRKRTLQNFVVTLFLVSSIWRIKVKESLALGKVFAETVVPKNVQSLPHLSSSFTSSINRFSDGIDLIISSFQAFEKLFIFLRLEKAWLIDMVDHEGVKWRAWVWTFVTFYEYRLLKHVLLR